MLTELAHHLGRLSHSSAYERLSWFVAWVADHTKATDDELLDLPMSRQEVADFLGIAPETVSRLFRRMEAGGRLLRVSARQYRYSADAPRDAAASAQHAAA
jgi:CRP-like cAMP-binding protein